MDEAPAAVNRFSNWLLTLCVLIGGWGLGEEVKDILRSESQSQASKLDVLVQKIVKKTGKSVLEVHLFKRNEKRGTILSF